MENEVKDGDGRDFSNDYGMSSLEQSLCIFLMIFSTIYFNVVNFLLIRKRKNYVIKHRGIALTIPSSLAGYIIVMNILFNEILYSMEYHNLYIWINNLFIVFVLMSACGRAIRLILLYNLNAFKAECILQIQNFNDNIINKPKIEVNSYMKTVDNIVKKKTGKWILIAPVVITVIVTAISEYIKSLYNSKPILVKFVEFAPINLFLMVYIIMCLYYMYSLRKIKDNETFGIKFEVICSFIVSLIVMIITMIMNFTNSQFLTELTHSGSYLYIIQTITGHFTSAAIPLILCYSEERKFKKQSQILSSAEFSKLLYQKPVIDDLKIIAVNDFCVENILFWETFIKIKELTYQCLTNTGVFEERKTAIKEENIKSMNKSLTDLYSNSDHHHKYIDKKAFELDKSKPIKRHFEYDPYYTYVINSNKKNGNKNSDDYFYSPKISNLNKGNGKNYFTPDDYKMYDIDPNIPLDSRLVPYYISFYKAFIDPYGPVTVNISSDIATNIFRNLFNNPTVGVFDEAKNDVITSMFLTLYPQYINLHFNK